MDPIAHTLVGGSLAETALRRTTPLAAATLLIGANLPDIDGVARMVGRDWSLGFRRGWTHGLLALVVLPLLLAAGVYLFDRAVRQRLRPARPARVGPLVGLAYLAVLSHPALDWLNNYGIRLLMPFDGRWFYGDAVFIIDPWIWLIAGASPALAHTRAPVSVGAWLLLGAAMTLLVTGMGWTPLAARVAWGVGLAVIVGVRISGRFQRRLTRVATLCVALVFAYIAAMVAGTWIARGQAERWLAGRGVTVTDITELMAAPLPANPFVRDVIAVTPDRYYFLEIDWLADEMFRVSYPSLPNGPPGPIAEAALRAPEVQGMRRWLRFPSYEVETTEEGYRVIIRDLRYSRIQRTGIGTAVVELDRELAPR